VPGGPGQVALLGQRQAEVAEQPVDPAQGRPPAQPGTRVAGQLTMISVTAWLSAWKMRSQWAMPSGPPYRSTSRS
jgi:hypothetical protein